MKKSPQAEGWTRCPRQASGFCPPNILFCGFSGVSLGVEFDLFSHRLGRRTPPVTPQSPAPVPALPAHPHQLLAVSGPPFPSSGHSGHSCLLRSRLALGPATHWAQPAALCQDKTEEESQAPCPLQGDPAPPLCLRALAGSLLPAGGTCLRSCLLRGLARRVRHGVQGGRPAGRRRLPGFFLSPWGCGSTPPPPPGSASALRT